uniref:NAC domain-containing protein 83-like n=1 Tax=Erigeron canadensis TaxID=72917 RepID=UPI001CB8C21B|nr:NAC domain-containing protein 83-like [Erigeron canadensis]
MDKMNFVKNGVLRLPPGFRFHPTDEELVVQYLKRKVHSFPLPASIIPEVDVCKSDPWQLPGDCEQERFFFSTKEVKYPNGNRSNRATLSGYWKATGLDKQIVTSKNNQVVGMKKTLVFYKGKPPSGSRTDWIMHEYRLATPQLTSPAQGNENWVICRIFLKKRGSNATKNFDENAITSIGDVSHCNEVKPKPVFYDFMAANKRRRTDLNLKPVSSYSGSSGITDDACSCDELEENSSTKDDVLRKKQSS